MDAIHGLLVVLFYISSSSGMMSIKDVHYAETTRLPVYLNCEKRYSYIEVGGVTMNADSMPEGREEKAKKECENQLKEPWKLVDQPRTTCYLTFGKKFDKKPDDVIRVIYRCFDTKPPKSPNWGNKKGEEKIITAKQKTPGKDVVLRCNRNKAMIVVKNTYINGEPADTDVHTSLKPDALLSECYGQWVAVLSSKSADKSQTTCRIPNDKSYGGELKIDFVCTLPPEVSQMEVVKPVGNAACLSSSIFVHSCVFVTKTLLYVFL